MRMSERQNKLLREFIAVVELFSKCSGQESVYNLLERFNYQYDPEME
jgi:hypothetical protein